MSVTNPRYELKPRISDLDLNQIQPMTIIAKFQQIVEKYGDRPAFCSQADLGQEWDSLSYRDYYQTVRIVANGFLKFGLQAGDGVGIMGFNHVAWMITNLATICCGAISAGIYTTNSPEITEYILRDCNAAIVVVDEAPLVQKIWECRDRLPNLKLILQYKGVVSIVDDTSLVKVSSWDNFMQLSQMINPLENVLDARISALNPKQCSSLIYTSGTTGNPKGVMLSHDNILWTTQSVIRTVGLSSETQEHLISYLPLSHVAAQMIDIYLPLVTASTIWFAQPSAFRGTLNTTLKEVQPTIFLGVPRVWEKIHDKMQIESAKITGLRRAIGNWAKQLASSRKPGSKPTGWWLANKLVFQKVRAALGLTRCKLQLTGSAPIANEILEYFLSLNLPIYEIYGMSESTGPITISYPNHFRIGSCGQAVPGTQVEVSSIGEICTRGRHVMLGYLNQPTTTAAAIDEGGWLHTGDLGTIDVDSGFVSITGRIREIIKTSGGEMVDFGRIENRLKTELPMISNCMLVGDRRNFLTILITLRSVLVNDLATDDLDPVALTECGKIASVTKTVSTAMQDAGVLKYIQNGLDRTNAASVSRAQKVQKFRILLQDFTVAGGELGPTLKLKRAYVLKKYESVIEEMYSGSNE